jgi:hypothetical protein
MAKFAIAMAILLLSASVATANGRYGYGYGHNHHDPYYGGRYHYYGGHYRSGYGWGGFAVYPRVIVGGPGPFWAGAPYSSYPYGYYPQPVIVAPPAQPRVYVQQPQQQYWYYCEGPKGYYPYVPQCRSEWLKVVPRTDSPNQ